MELKGSETERGLRNAVSKEAEAWGLYRFFAEQAQKEGYQEIAFIFEETAKNEKAHAEIIWNLLSSIGDTAENLREAGEMEDHESGILYPSLAKTARKEGFAELAGILERIGAIEDRHGERFRKKLSEMCAGRTFARSHPTAWICRNCGNRVDSDAAPGICSVCRMPKGYFQEMPN